MFDGQNAQKGTYGIPKSKYDFVQQYVIVDPKEVKNGRYKYWQDCKFTPVAYEGSGVWLDAINLPSYWAQPFLARLENSAPEIRNNPCQRLISVIKLDGNHKLYIVPDLSCAQRSIICGEYNKDAKHRKDWLFYLTPNIRRAIVEQMKIRSHSY